MADKTKVKQDNCSAVILTGGKGPRQSRRLSMRFPYGGTCCTKCPEVADALQGLICTERGNSCGSHKARDATTWILCFEKSVLRIYFP